MVMNRSKKTLVSVAVAILIGVGLIYFAGSCVERKNETKTPENKHLNKDSASLHNNESIPVEMGAKPETNQETGSIKIVEDFIKSTVKNPATYEFYEWSEVTTEKGYWKVKCKYRGVSSFNKEVTTTAWFYIQNNKVVHTKIISKI
jgi:hypothetical protein